MTDGFSSVSALSDWQVGVETPTSGAVFLGYRRGRASPSPRSEAHVGIDVTPDPLAQYDRQCAVSGKFLPEGQQVATQSVRFDRLYLGFYGDWGKPAMASPLPEGDGITGRRKRTAVRSRRPPDDVTKREGRRRKLPRRFCVCPMPFERCSSHTMMTTFHVNAAGDRRPVHVHQN